jgi:hypothetical protein
MSALTSLASFATDSLEDRCGQYPIAFDTDAVLMLEEHTVLLVRNISMSKLAPGLSDKLTSRILWNIRY